MSIVFAAVVPHSPVLLPTIGKEHLKKLRKTVTALRRLEQELYAAHPDAILIVSPHGPVSDDHFTLDFAERYVPDLKEFGVMDAGLEYRSDMRLMSALREQLEDRDVPFALRSSVGLEYGAAVPLSYLAAHLPGIPILPLSPARLPAKAQFEFGQAVQETLMRSTRRVAVVASADLSHRLTRSAPAGYSPFGRKFDEKILHIFAEKNWSALLTFEAELAGKAAQCGLPVLTVLSGILDGIEATPELLSYEGPFGIGCATIHYRFA